MMHGHFVFDPRAESDTPGTRTRARHPPAPLPRHQSGGSLLGGVMNTHSNTVPSIDEEEKPETTYCSSTFLHDSQLKIYTTPQGLFAGSAVSYLSLLIARSNFKWDVWEMKPETREWTKLPGIDLEAQKCAFIQLCYKHDSSLKLDDGSLDCKLAPVGWLKYREVVVFIVLKRVSFHALYNQSRLRVAYNFQTQDICLFELETNYHPYLVHRNSLLWLDGR
ncbi:hypothetical protein PHJA_001477300 [Phtheirospermum japonicum]|uniref:Uncharacterized protein n=1 Tax=Phtheirospermum japonicum TaxID=374723 RepID=A0A830C2S0_9LAMI|nr:hypothetical protein PHJA_001477300 [Phtheirospermum japonicum]